VFTPLPAKLSQPLDINVTLLDNKKCLIATMSNTNIQDNINIQTLGTVINNLFINITYFFAKN
jgi:hypothetical protein